MGIGKSKTPVSSPGNSIKIALSLDGPGRVMEVQTLYKFAYDLRNIARTMLRAAKSAKDAPDSYWELKAFIHGAIILSYASLEAAYNEVIHLRALSAESPLDEAERKVIYAIAQENLTPRGESNTLQKFNLLLRILNKPELKPGDPIYQNANLVRMLRNMIIHPVPGRVTTFIEDEDFDYSSQQDIVKKLKTVLGLPKTATFPEGVLTFECAKWAVRSCEAFLHAFDVTSGIDVGFITDPIR